MAGIFNNKYVASLMLAAGLLGEKTAVAQQPVESRPPQPQTKMSASTNATNAAPKHFIVVDLKTSEEIGDQVYAPDDNRRSAAATNATPSHFEVVDLQSREVVGDQVYESHGNLKDSEIVTFDKPVTASAAVNSANATLLKESENNEAEIARDDAASAALLLQNIQLRQEIAAAQKLIGENEKKVGELDAAANKLARINGRISDEIMWDKQFPPTNLFIATEVSTNTAPVPTPKTAPSKTIEKH